MVFKLMPGDYRGKERAWQTPSLPAALVSRAPWRGLLIWIKTTSLAKGFHLLIRVRGVNIWGRDDYVEKSHDLPPALAPVRAIAGQGIWNSYRRITDAVIVGRLTPRCTPRIEQSYKSRL
jgi:hypothetical protein